MTTALITGATAGIGRAFADRSAALGHRLVLVARDTPRLADTARQLTRLGAPEVETLPADLSTARGRAAVEQRVADPSRPVDLLVNNAGYGLAHSFRAGTAQEEDALLDVLVRAPMRITHAALPGMLERGHGSIVNVASLAAFLPRGTYSAAKAWVVTFTESLAAGLHGTGVRAVAVCPGFTRTEFHERAGIPTSDIPGWMWLDAGQVVDAALRGLDRGTPVVVPGARYKALMAAARFVPRAARTRVGRGVSKRS